MPAALRLACVLCTSAVAGAYSSMLLLPAQRLAACMASTLHPPASLVASSLLEWRTVPLQPPAWKVALLFCTETLPALSLLLWVNCISEGLLGLDARQRAMAQGVALLLTGALRKPALPGIITSRWNPENRPEYSKFLCLYGNHCRKPSLLGAVLRTTCCGKFVAFCTGESGLPA